MGTVKLSQLTLQTAPVAGNIFESSSPNSDGTFTTVGLLLSTVSSFVLATLDAAPLSVSRGGTGGATQSTARSGLGLGSIATQPASGVAITGGSITGITDLAIADGGTGASTASAARTNLGVAIGTDVQAYDAELAALATTTSAADTLPYYTGSGTAGTTVLTPFIRTLLDDTNLAQAQATLGLTIGTNVQAFDNELSALSTTVSAADKVPYYTGSGAANTADFNSLGRSIVGATSARAIAAIIGCPYKLASSSTQSSVTGTNTETTLATIVVPANMIGPTGQIEIIALFTSTANANTRFFRVKFGGTLFSMATANNSTQGGFQVYTRISNRTATSQIGLGAASNSGFGGSGTSVNTTSSIDTTSAVNIDITGQTTVTTDTITLESYVIRLL